ncbi:dolichyl-diphosphooligosaccharide--protein glycosyltransferase subunit STT3B-like [Xenia sp. Carnegie-2017]|uniref:dolichyl-diphosphooligosaccharide--protein glycosyltransferase subunit STT3B-like n=1 Tax=Xenia sp. Carnegie-2017 TaxID=2897299 RepID=UPI001F0426AE|nr:dolichyl-diphosphooligosaccharide--protein glycosyltransferase subunit STT3B-like [Xenia sp. Carnegie-2017]
MEVARALSNKKQAAFGVQSLLCFVVLSLAWLVGFASRLFAIIRFESIIHEFDPWFNYRATHHLVSHGFYNFLNWFDERAWYPLGRIVGGTVFPGLMVTSAALHSFLGMLNITVHIRDVCVFLAPLFSGMTAIATYFLTKELWNSRAGLFAACFIAIAPGYISRSVAGSYDNEGIAIFALQFTYFLWIKSVKTGSIFWASSAAIAYFYMVSAWGGYVFIINLIPLHIFFLLLMGRFTFRIYVAYSTFFIMGLILSMQIPFVGFQPIRTSEHMASAGVFALLQAYAFLKFLQNHSTWAEIQEFFHLIVAGAAGLVFAVVVFLTYLGYIAPWSGRFYSLYDTGYAKIHIPIIASVSEHQPTTWVSFFFDLHILACTFPAGLWFVIKKINDERVFIVLYAVTASYFAGVMVRLMLTLTPVVCVLAAVAFSVTLDNYIHSDSIPINEDDEDRQEEQVEEQKDIEKKKPSRSKGGIKTNKRKERHSSQSSVTSKMFDEKESEETKSTDSSSNLGGFVVMCMLLTLMLYAVHCTWVTSNAYSSPSVVLASTNYDGSRNILDDFREAYFWLRQNTPDDSRVMSWWDYGYQIAGMGNRTTLVDNNTWNNSHIAMVGKAMSSNETAAYKIMRSLDVDYVLVIFGGVIGYSGDDINKFLWMVRIAEGEHPKDIKESDYFTQNGEFRVDAGGSPVLLNCLMYKLCYHRFGELQLDFRTPSGFDRTRNVEIGNKNVKLKYLDEVFTSEHWLVRIYKVKDLSNRYDSQLKRRVTNHIPRNRFYSRKTSSKQKGSIKNKHKFILGQRIKKRSKKLKTRKTKKST